LNIQEIIKAASQNLEKCQSDRVKALKGDRLAPLKPVGNTNSDLFFQCFKDQERMKECQQIYDLKPNLYTKMNEVVA
jgi:hypothetical protein